MKAVHSSKAIDDKHLRVDMAALKELLETRELASVSKVQSARQLANVLTKKKTSAQTLVSAVNSH